MFLLKIILKIGFTGTIETTIDMVDKLRDVTLNKLDSKYIDRLTNIDLLILDDIGTEKKTDYSYEKMYKIINTRYNKKKAIVFTSNIDFKSISKIYDERLVSRMAEMINLRFITIADNKDWRYNQAKKETKEIEKIEKKKNSK